MNPCKEYKISFGRMAGTLIYEDDEGEVYFAFDISPAGSPQDGKWMIDLSSIPRTKDLKRIDAGAADHERLSFAMDKVKEYLISRKYQVHVRQSREG